MNYRFYMLENCLHPLPMVTSLYLLKTAQFRLFSQLSDSLEYLLLEFIVLTQILHAGSLQSVSLRP